MDHQSVYRDYLDAKTKSQYKITIKDVTGDGQAITSAPAASLLAGKYDVTMEVEILEERRAVQRFFATGTNPAIQLGTLPQKRFTIQGYFPDAEFKFQDAYTTGLGSNVNAPTPPATGWGPQTGTITLQPGNLGTYVIKQTNVQFDPLAQAGWQAYGYIAAGVLETEGMTLYADVADTGLAFGTVLWIRRPTTCRRPTSRAANVPRRAVPKARLSRGGGRRPEDFAACKECHFDDRKGGHLDWQWMVDQPSNGRRARSRPTREQVRVQGQRHAGHPPDARDGIRVSACRCRTASPATRGKIDRITDGHQVHRGDLQKLPPGHGKDAWARAPTRTPTGHEVLRSPSVRRQ